MIVFIEKISLNDGILFIKPNNFSFDMIYRSAMGVHWDEHEHCLYHNVPEEWDVFQWYKQIVSAVKSEYGVILDIHSDTLFENLPDEIEIALRDNKAGEIS